MLGSQGASGLFTTAPPCVALGRPTQIFTSMSLTEEPEHVVLLASTTQPQLAGVLPGVRRELRL